MRLLPHHFTAHREGRDAVRLEGWNEDGTHEVTVALTQATGLDLIAALSAALAAPAQD